MSDVDHEYARVHAENALTDVDIGYDEYGPAFINLARAYLALGREVAGLREWRDAFGGAADAVNRLATETVDGREKIAALQRDVAELREALGDVCALGVSRFSEVGKRYECSYCKAPVVAGSIVHREPCVWIKAQSLLERGGESDA